jgi:hypothetical protein
MKEQLRSKKNLQIGLLLSTCCFALLTALFVGETGCARYHPVLNEDPALLEKNRGEGEENFVSAPPPSAWKHIKKVVVIILENTDLSVSLALPNFSKFAEKGALLSNYFAITHPSQPNYLSLISGSTQGVTGNANVDLPMKHLGNLLEQNKMTWKAYGEDYPGDCFLDSTSENYVRKHMPFLSFQNVQKDKTRCNQVVPAKFFKSDLTNSQLADLSFYIPNQLNNGHDTGAQYADRWFGTEILPLLADPLTNPLSPLLNDTLFVVTFDEGSGEGDNKIYTVLYGSGVQGGAKSTRAYSHFSLLKTIEMIFDLPTLGLNDVNAHFISDVWKI